MSYKKKSLPKIVQCFLAFFSFCLLLTNLCLVNNANSSASKRPHVISFVSDSIDLIHEHHSQVNVMLHYYNFGVSGLELESYLIEESLKERGYNIVYSPKDADYIIQLTIKGESKIDQQSVDNIVKYWMYKEVTQSMSSPGSPDSVNFTAADGGFGISGGSQTASAETQSGGGTLGSALGKSGPLILLGGSVAGGISATIWQTTSLATSGAGGPVLVALSSLFGAGAAFVVKEIIEEYPSITIADIVFMRRVGKNEKVEQKFNTLKKDSKGSWYEEYVAIKNPEWIRNSTRLYMVSRDRPWSRKKTRQEKTKQIVSIISNLLPVYPLGKKELETK